MEQFSFSGYTASNVMACVTDGTDIYQTDYAGNRQPIGKTIAAYTELEQTTAQYYDKLVELGVIVPPKSQEELRGEALLFRRGKILRKAPQERLVEELMAEMQGSMLEMSSIISSLSGEIRELKENGAKQCTCSCGEDVSKREPKRGGAKGAGGDQRDGGQP